MGRIEEAPTGAPATAVGRLLTCPSCVGQWASAGFVKASGRRARRGPWPPFAADVSDFLHVAYRGLEGPRLTPQQALAPRAARLARYAM